MEYTSKNTKVLYLGFNSMLKHKRGVENVIDFQSKANNNSISYYIHWDDKTSVYRYKGFLCIGIKASFLKYFVFNWLIFRIRKKEKEIFIHSHCPHYRNIKRSTLQLSLIFTCNNRSIIH